MLYSCLAITKVFFKASFTSQNLLPFARAWDRLCQMAPSGYMPFVTEAIWGFLNEAAESRGLPEPATASRFAMLAKPADQQIEQADAQLDLVDELGGLRAAVLRGKREIGLDADARELFLDLDQHIWPSALIIHIELCALLICPLEAFNLETAVDRFISESSD